MSPSIPRKISLPVLGKYLIINNDFPSFSNVLNFSPIPYKIHEKLKGKKAVIFAIPGKTIYEVDS